MSQREETMNMWTVVYQNAGISYTFWPIQKESINPLLKMLQIKFFCSFVKFTNIELIAIYSANWHELEKNNQDSRIWTDFVILILAYRKAHKACFIGQ